MNQHNGNALCNARWQQKVSSIIVIVHRFTIYASTANPVESGTQLFCSYCYSQEKAHTTQENQQCKFNIYKLPCLDFRRVRLRFANYYCSSGSLSNINPQSLVSIIHHPCQSFHYHSPKSVESGHLLVDSTKRAL